MTPGSSVVGNNFGQSIWVMAFLHLRWEIVPEAAAQTGTVNGSSQEIMLKADYEDVGFSIYIHLKHVLDPQTQIHTGPLVTVVQGEC